MIFNIGCIPFHIFLLKKKFLIKHWKIKWKRLSFGNAVCLQQSDNNSNNVKIWAHDTLGCILPVPYSRLSSAADCIYWLILLYFSVAFSSSYVKVMNIKLLLLGSPGPLLTGNYIFVCLNPLAIRCMTLPCYAIVNSPVPSMFCFSFFPSFSPTWH